MESTRIIVAAVLVAGIMACEREEGPAASDRKTVAPLAGTEWVLQSMRSGGVEAPVVPPAITLAFGVDSTFAGTAGCNRYFGRFLPPAGDSLVLGAVGSTRMACPEPAMTQEYQYLQALGAGVRYRMTDGALVLLDGAGEVLRFVRGSAGE